MDHASGYASLLWIMFKSLILAFILVHVHGAVCPAVSGVGRVLLAGLRDGDVTSYHSVSTLHQL